MFFASFANASKKQILSDIFQAALEFQRFCEFNYGFIALPADLCYADNGNSEALASAKASAYNLFKNRFLVLKKRINRIIYIVYILKRRYTL